MYASGQMGGESESQMVQNLRSKQERVLVLLPRFYSTIALTAWKTAANCLYSSIGAFLK